jgi:hypothetical protein
MLAALAVTVTFGGSTFAALVNPGQTIPTNPQDTINPSGDLLEEDVRQVAFDYTAPEGFDFAPVETPTRQATFRSQVYRDPVTQRLSFVYRWEDVPLFFGREGASLDVSSFAGFSTDVTAEVGGGDGSITRSADGSTIQASTPGAGLGTLPSVLVITDATEYDSNGSVSGSVGDEFNVFEISDPENQSVRLAIAELTLNNTFQPITDGGTVIPLPAGVWAGLVMLGGAAGVARRLRRH